MRLPSEVDQFDHTRARMLSPYAPEPMEYPEAELGPVATAVIMAVMLLALPLMLLVLMLYLACAPVAWASGLVRDTWRFLRPRAGQDAMKWMGPPPAPGKRGKAASGRL